ncbi:hypothetical protein BHU72_13395 [Desulfuribacillus stibiiarsenatis]|uniref:Uncharacterized protein n=1 Tax=Desulfuribacillus stibiiarsenatis TaxID=1390249 RepID=A0A1E5L8U4_9FIRM|nr:hypothetical protein [Desulfuribacillus stibiiarsenatis]OEH86409.1 hypothetical protein BHU72_13395 [Desulfuribacillus stibiiarsenatis]
MQTNKLGTLIKEIQSGVNETISAMNESTEEVLSGTQATEKTEAVFVTVNNMQTLLNRHPRSSE